jgi:murein DD-endopeptidase MepM/ murein hydrolase activator NlpD
MIEHISVTKRSTLVECFGGLFRKAWWLPVLISISGCVPSSPITYLDWGLDQHSVQEVHNGDSIQKKSGGPPRQEQTASCVQDNVFVWPLNGSLVRRFSEGSKDTSNSGIDILGYEDAPVVAAWNGRVTFAGDLRGYGKVLLIAHCDDLTGVYANLSALTVRKGDNVLKGQNLGTLSGRVGESGSMLHFELRRKTLPIDPILHLKSGFSESSMKN